MFKFSQQLRMELIEYIEKINGISISHEQADEYLESLADLFIVYNKLTIKE